MNINEHVKELRKVLNMKQLDFAKELTISQGHLSDIENGRKEVSSKIQEIILLKFNVNENWLRSGQDPIFVESHVISLDDYAKQKDITDFELTFIKSYLNIPKDLRHSLEEHFKSEILPNLTNIIINTEDCACEYEDASNNEKSIEERVAEAEREYLIAVHGVKPEQLDTRDKILNFNPLNKSDSDKEHA